jgi:hypothetical protein
MSQMDQFVCPAMHQLNLQSIFSSAQSDKICEIQSVKMNPESIESEHLDAAPKLTLKLAICLGR